MVQIKTSNMARLRREEDLKEPETSQINQFTGQKISFYPIIYILYFSQREGIRPNQ